MSKRHNAIHISTNESFTTIFVGGGLCIMRNISPKWIFNPEFSIQSALGKSQRIISLVSKFTYELHPRIYLSVGPSFVYNGSKSGELTTPIFSIYEGASANARHKFLIGMRAGLRFNITTVKK
jgi:hypothetical protein